MPYTSTTTLADPLADGGVEARNSQGLSRSHRNVAGRFQSWVAARDRTYDGGIHVPPGFAPCCATRHGLSRRHTAIGPGIIWRTHARADARRVRGLVVQDIDVSSKDYGPL